MTNDWRFLFLSHCCLKVVILGRAHNNFTKIHKRFANIKKSCTFASFLKNDQENNGSVAQLVEQQTLNLWVVGSTPTRFTKKTKVLERCQSGRMSRS